MRRTATAPNTHDNLMQASAGDVRDAGGSSGFLHNSLSHPQHAHNAERTEATAAASIPERSLKGEVEKVEPNASMWDKKITWDSALLIQFADRLSFRG